MEGRRTYRVYDWIGTHVRSVVVASLGVVVALGVVGPVVANTADASFEPDGELYSTFYEAEDTLRAESTIKTAVWLVESSSGDSNVLTAEALREWSALTDTARKDPIHANHLVDRYDPTTRTAVPGLLSVADIVDKAIPGGLAGADDADVAAALDEAFADDSAFAEFRHTLSEQASRIEAGWTSPAFTTLVVYESADFQDLLHEEAWLRSLQTDLRDGAVLTDAIGVTIDGDTTFGESAQQSAPYIFLAVALIIVLVAFVHRSYWSAVVVGAGLAATTLAYYGTTALVGLKMGSLLLAFVVPIAMISFGVDFYIHGLGRVRESQVESGLATRKAYPFGMTAVFTAMLLAVMSSVAAFLANTASGIEAIIHFGIGSAISLAFAYLLLGQLAPRVTIGLEDWVGPDPVKGASRYMYALGTLVMAVVGGLAVALSAVMPTIGAVCLVLYLGALIALPATATRRRNRRALISGRELVMGHNGSAHGLEAAGSVVHALAKWRAVTIPVVIAIAAIGFMQATRVESGFKIEDFLSRETSFAQSIERITYHFPSSGEGSSFIYIEGDLTEPANLEAIDAAVTQLRSSGADFGTNGEGQATVELHAADIVRMAMASPAAEAIAASGPALTDSDGNGIPDTSAAVAAVYRHVTEHGVATPNGGIAVEAGDLGRYFVDLGSSQATAVAIRVGSFTDPAVILPVEEALVSAAATFEAEATNATARASGEVLVQHHAMDAFTRSMLVSLPLALVLAFLITALMLRSIRFAIVSVLPIGLVVIGVYAFMATFGYSVNVVTATIAAISVGVGIDFSTHFTARFREEMNGSGDVLAAVRRAGAGTGGALVLSALTSVLGFLVMAMAPTPIFATFGTLTAVMIALSLIVALFVLPSLLVLVSGPGARDNDIASVAVEEVLSI